MEVAVKLTPERVKTAPAVVLPETWEDEIRMNAFWIEKEEEVAGEEDM